MSNVSVKHINVLNLIVLNALTSIFLSLLYCVSLLSFNILCFLLPVVLQLYITNDFCMKNLSASIRHPNVRCRWNNGQLTPDKEKGQYIFQYQTSPAY